MTTTPEQSYQAACFSFMDTWTWMQTHAWTRAHTHTPHRAHFSIVPLVHRMPPVGSAVEGSSHPMPVQCGFICTFTTFDSVYLSPEPYLRLCMPLCILLCIDLNSKRGESNWSFKLQEKSLVGDLTALFLTEAESHCS